MPGRVSRANTAAAPKAPAKKAKKRSFDAYSAAQKQVTEKRIPRHRLGEDIDDEPRQKRQKADDDAEEDELQDVEGDLDSRLKKPKQRRVMGQDDNLEYGSDSSGNEWTMGGLAEDDDDSDLDSDEAFGQSDDEFQQGFTFRGSKSTKDRARTKNAPGPEGRSIDLNEKEESEDDDGDSDDDEGLGLGDDAVDLAVMLDDGSEEMNNGGIEDNSRESESEADDEDVDDEPESEEDGNDEEDMLDEERLARMQDRIEALDGRSATASAIEPQEVVTGDDFMEAIGMVPEKPKSKKKQAKAGPIAAPLPRRQQDRINREVATEKAKAELDKWRDTVTRNRRAEHLSFPLHDPSDQGATLGREKFQPSTQQKPQNELEESIQRIMEESGLAAKRDEDDQNVGDEETALLKAEELAEKTLPIEEVMERRAELRRQRELLFREEIKAKRIAKIKSKSYRRVHRKEKERQAEQERLELEGMGMSGMDETEQERFDRKRAEHRMSTRHNDSKWAKTMKQTNRTIWDEDFRGGVVEQARRHEDLKKRIAGRDISSENDSDLPSTDEHDGSEDEANVLKQLTAGEGSTIQNRLSNLKFMRDAEERKRKSNDEDIERIRKELAIADGDEEASDVEGQDLGRAIFGPQKNGDTPAPREKKLEFEAPDGTDDDGAQDDRIMAEQPAANAKPAPKVVLKKKAGASGPLAKSFSGEDDAKSPSSTSAWMKPKRKSDKTQSGEAEILVPSNISPVSMPQPAKVKKTSKVSAASDSTAGDTNGWTTVAVNDQDDSHPEDNLANPMLSTKEQQLTIQQRAFAGDDVQAAFDAEKADQVEDEDEKEISNHLPGWGSWTGDGLSKSIRKANKKAAHNPLWKTKLDGVKQADRKDAKLPNVIVSEKSDRKGKKYLAPVLPHEFETKEQYERSRRLPMGPEWTTKEVHQRMVKPRVIVRKGVNVKALERPIA